MSEFGDRKGLLIERVPTEKMVDFVVPQIHLKNVQSSNFFYVNGGENGRGLTIADIWAPAGRFC